MNSAAHDLALLLVSEGILPALGGSAPWSAYVGGEPTSPDQVVTLYDTPGLSIDTDAADTHQPALLVRGRGTAYNATHAKVSEVHDWFVSNQSLVAATSVFDFVEPTSSIFSLGRDENNRFIVVCNFVARRTRKEA